MVTYTRSELLQSKGVGQPGQLTAYAASHGALLIEDVKLLDVELYRLAPLLPLNPDLIAGQICDECGTFTNKWFHERFNCGSLGVTGDTAQDAASPTFTSAVAGLRAMLAHIAAYCGLAALNATDAATVKQLGLDKPLKDYDPTFDRVNAAGYYGSVHILSDFDNHYAQNPDYSIDIAKQANAVVVAPVARGCWFPGSGRA